MGGVSGNGGAEVTQNLRAAADFLLDAAVTLEGLAGHLSTLRKTSAIPSPSDVSKVPPCVEEEKFYVYKGVRIPLGELTRSYKPHGLSEVNLKALVTPSGLVVADKPYPSPSAAARAAKRLAGAPLSAISENGWRFWQYRDPITGSLSELDTLRSYRREKHKRLTLEDLGL